MRIGGLIAVALVGVSLVACSTAERARITAKNLKPTGYVERVWALGTPGYGDEEVSANTQEIWFVGNSVTSPQRAMAMARYHAAKIGEQRGSSHFSFTSINVRITCDRQGSTVRATGNATYGDAESLPGKSLLVEEVIRGFGRNLRALDDVSFERRQKVFIANQQSCSTQRFIRPEEVRTQAEIEAQEAEKAQGDK
jgi:hypothetical protein